MWYFNDLALSTKLIRSISYDLNGNRNCRVLNMLSKMMVLLWHKFNVHVDGPIDGCVSVRMASDVFCIVVDFQKVHVSYSESVAYSR